MTPHERYRAVLGGGPPDIVPRLPILMQFAAEHIGSNYRAFASDYRVLVSAGLRCAEEFASTNSAPSRTLPRNGGLRRVARIPAQRRTDLSQAPARRRPGRGQTSSPQSPHRPAHARPPRRSPRIPRPRRRPRFDHGLGRGPGRRSRRPAGALQLFFDLIDDEPAARAVMARCVATAIAFARAQVAAGADTIGVGDAVASQVSAAVYESLILPFERPFFTALHAIGVFVRLPICGNITHLLPGIATLGVDIVDLDHRVDLAHARRVLGPRPVIVGNVDPVAGVMRGSPDSIRRAVARCRAAAGARFMVNAGCEIPARTPVENLHALCTPIAPAPHAAASLPI